MGMFLCVCVCIGGIIFWSHRRNCPAWLDTSAGDRAKGYKTGWPGVGNVQLHRRTQVDGSELLTNLFTIGYNSRRTNTSGTMRLT